MKFPYNKIFISLVIAATPMSVSAASISDQMEDAFGSLSNVTTPKAYETAKRGIFSGGQVFIKNETKRVTPITVTAPSFSVGCGGIDIYGGAFSFINADQMLENFQAIGANALGYGVKIAIQAACPTCEQVMTSLEKTAQLINSMNIDSCQAAQGIVNASKESSATSQANTTSKVELTNSGFVDDFSKAWTWASEESNSPSNELKDKDPAKHAKEITGNIVWRSLKSSNASTVFGGGDEFLEMIMTMTGTVIIQDPVPSSNEGDPKLIKLDGHGVSLASIINGGDMKLYDCDTTTADGCLNPPVSPSQTINDVGLQERIATSLVAVFDAFNSNSDWPQKAKDALSFNTLAGQACLDKIYAAAYSNADSNIANMIANACAGRMALEASYYQIISYLKTARSALANAGASDSQQAASEKAEEILEESEDKYTQEYEALNLTFPAEKLYILLNGITFRTTKADTLVGWE